MIPALVISHTLIAHLKAKIPSSLCQSSLSTVFWYPHTLLLSILVLENVFHWTRSENPTLKLLCATVKKYTCFQANVLTQICKGPALILLVKGICPLSLSTVNGQEIYKHISDTQYHSCQLLYKDHIYDSTTTMYIRINTGKHH